MGEAPLDAIALGRRSQCDIARGKRGTIWPRLGPTPDHDTEYVRWLNKLPRNIPEVTPNEPDPAYMTWSDGSVVTWSDGESVEWSTTA